MQYTQPLARLIEAFQRFPGVGPKSAQRMAFHVLKQAKADVYQFSEALIQAIESIQPCTLCHNLTTQALCEICTNPQRNAGVICVVAEVRDLYALERTGEHRGRYHVLQGLVSPLAGIGPENLTIAHLVERVERPETPQEAIQEVILALPPSIEGDTTSLYLSKLLQPYPIKLTRIGFGLPVGGELEYADSLTISRALAARQVIGV